MMQTRFYHFPLLEIQSWAGPLELSAIEMGLGLRTCPLIRSDGKGSSNKAEHRARQRPLLEGDFQRALTGQPPAANISLESVLGGYIQTAPNCA